MNSKAILFLALTCSSATLTFTWAQSGGGGGAGAGAGGTGGGASTGASAGANTGAAAATAAAANASSTTSTSTATGTPGAISPGSTPPASGAPSGGPDTRSTMPSRSILDTATPPDTSATGAALPPGLSVAPRRPGISPLSGLPVSDLPAVSRGTTPVGPETQPVVARPAAEPAPAAERAAQPGITAPGAVAAHLPTNPQIGMSGMTTYVPVPPPTAQTEATPATTRNEAGQVWVPGHYAWENGQWRWVGGTWQRPPSPEATWIPATYDAETKRWTAGHWAMNAGTTKR